MRKRHEIRDYRDIERDGILLHDLERDEHKAGTRIYNTSSKSTFKIQPKTHNSYTKTAKKQRDYRRNLKSNDPEKYLIFLMENKDRVNRLKGVQSLHEQVLMWHIEYPGLTYKQIAGVYKTDNHRCSSLLFGARKLVKNFGSELCLSALKKLSEKRGYKLKYLSIEAMRGES